MRLRTQPEQETDSAVAQRSESAEPTESSVVTTPLFRLSRALFGGILAFNAIDNFRNLEGRIAYAESKNTPLARLSVPAVSGGLLFGGLGVAFWRRPATAAAAVAGFLIGVTPVMHDFWNTDDPEQQQQQVIHFLKNTALLGAALAFLEIGQQEGER